MPAGVRRRGEDRHGPRGPDPRQPRCCRTHQGDSTDRVHRRLPWAAAHPPRRRHHGTSDLGLVPPRHTAAAPDTGRRQLAGRRSGARRGEGGDRRGGRAPALAIVERQGPGRRDQPRSRPRRHASLPGRGGRPALRRTFAQAVDRLAGAGRLPRRPERQVGQLCRATPGGAAGRHGADRGRGRLPGEPPDGRIAADALVPARRRPAAPGPLRRLRRHARHRLRATLPSRQRPALASDHRSLTPNLAAVPVLCEFRSRLLAGGADERLSGKLLEVCQARGLLKARGRQRTDSTRVLASIRALNRLELVGETLRAALNGLATVAQDWLRRVAPKDWYGRYAHRVGDGRLPRAEAEREAYARTVGEDGFALLDLLDRPEAPEGLRSLPAVGVLRRVWERQFVREGGAPPGGGVRRRGKDEPQPARDPVESRHDPEARYRTRSGISWIGYLVHTIRTQSTVRLRRPPALRRRAVQRDDMPDLQAAFVNEDALDHELRDRLLVGGRGLVEPAAHPFAERRQVGHDLVRLGAPLA